MEDMDFDKPPSIGNNPSLKSLRMWAMTQPAEGRKDGPTPGVNLLRFVQGLTGDQIRMRMRAERHQARMYPSSVRGWFITGIHGYTVDLKDELVNRYVYVLWLKDTYLDFTGDQFSSGSQVAVVRRNPGSSDRPPNPWLTKCLDHCPRDRGYRCTRPKNHAGRHVSAMDGHANTIRHMTINFSYIEKHWYPVAADA